MKDRDTALPLCVCVVFAWKMCLLPGSGDHKIEIRDCTCYWSGPMRQATGRPGHQAAGRLFQEGKHAWTGHVILQLRVV